MDRMLDYGSCDDGSTPSRKTIYFYIKENLYFL